MGIVLSPDRLVGHQLFSLPLGRKFANTLDARMMPLGKILSDPIPIFVQKDEEIIPLLLGEMRL